MTTKLFQIGIFCKREKMFKQIKEKCNALGPSLEVGAVILVGGLVGFLVIHF